MERPATGSPAPVARLTPDEKRALLAELLRKKAAANGTGPAGIGHAALTTFPLAPAPRDQPPPQSLGQETLWFLDQLEPGNTTYNCPAVVRVTGPFDAEALRRAFELIVHRHESLRSTFRLDNDQRVVEILPPATFPLEVTDLSDLP